MKVVLPTYREIGWIVKAYALLHDMYWAADVTLLAEDDYSSGRFDFARPPDTNELRWVNGEIPNWHFTDVLRWYLEQIGDEYVIIMLADYLITGPVDTDRIEQLEEYMIAHPSVLRGQIGADGGYQNGEMTDRYRDIEIWEGHFLPTSLTPGMWNRELLLELMTRRDTSWGMEIKGNDKFLKSSMRSIAPAPLMLPYINAIRGRDMSSVVMTKAVYEQVGHLMAIQPKALLD